MTSSTSENFINNKMLNRNLLALALMATTTFAQVRPDTTDDQEQPEEPDQDKFPREWSEEQRCSEGTAQCKTTDPGVEKVAMYDEPMMLAYEECKYDWWCQPRRAYCRLQHNPAYPTTYPYGYVNLW